MKSQNSGPDVSALDCLELSEAVGDFIRYWGFRRIHGQIWTQLYLSKEPLSGVVLVERLRVSKALVSPALQELLGYGLIKHVGGDEKTKTYAATEDVYGVIRKILIEREKVMIKKAADTCCRLIDGAKGSNDNDLDLVRVKSLNEMIKNAGSALEIVIKLANKDSIFKWRGLKKSIRA